HVLAGLQRAQRPRVVQCRRQSHVHGVHVGHLQQIGVPGDRPAAEFRAESLRFRAVPARHCEEFESGNLAHRRKGLLPRNISASQDTESKRLATRPYVHWIPRCVNRHLGRTYPHQYAGRHPTSTPCPPFREMPANASRGATKGLVPCICPLIIPSCSNGRRDVVSNVGNEGKECAYSSPSRAGTRTATAWPPSGGLFARPGTRSGSQGSRRRPTWSPTPASPWSRSA